MCTGYIVFFGTVTFIGSLVIVFEKINWLFANPVSFIVFYLDGWKDKSFKCFEEKQRKNQFR